MYSRFGSGAVPTAQALVPIVLCSLCALAGGCAANTNAPLSMNAGTARVRSSVLAATNVTTEPRAEGCHLDLILDRSPERPFLVLGQVTTVWTGMDRRGLRATDEEALAQLRTQACRTGAHALFQIRTAIQDQWVPRSTPPGAIGGNAFARTVVVTAIMAVYVRRDGAPMPPPEGARRVIRVPTPLGLQFGTPAASTDEAAMAWEQGITDPWAVPAD